MNLTMGTVFLTYLQIRMMNDVFHNEIITREKFIFSVRDKVAALERKRMEFCNHFNQLERGMNADEQKHYSQMCSLLNRANRRMDAVRREMRFLKEMLDVNSLN